VILCGGLGTRLSEKFPGVPKALVPVGNKPVIDHQIEALMRTGVSHFLFLAGHLGEAIETHIDNSPYARMAEVHHEGTPLGTAGALRKVRTRIADDFFLLSGDVMIGTLPWPELAYFHSSNNAVVTVGIRLTDHPQDSDLGLTDPTGRIISFGRGVPYDPHAGPLGVTSLYAVSRTALDTMSSDARNWERDVLIPLVATQASVYAFMLRGYIRDMGTPERWERVDRDVRNGMVP